MATPPACETAVVVLTSWGWWWGRVPEIIAEVVLWGGVEGRGGLCLMPSIIREKSEHCPQPPTESP